MKKAGVYSAIEKLYSITKTPMARFYPEKVVSDLLNPTNNGAALDFRVQREIVFFLLRLFDTPEDLKGAGLINRFVFPFLDPFLKSAALPKKDQSIVMEGIEVWMSCLLSLPDKSLYFADITILESQIFRFHLEASGLKKPRRYGERIQAEESSEPSPLYRTYAPIVHLRIREFMKKALLKKNPEDTIDEHIRSARMFFTFIQQSIKYAANHPPKIPEYYINNFVEEYDRIVNVRISRAVATEEGGFVPLGQRASDYKRFFCTLMKNDYTPLDQEDRNLLPVWADWEIADYDFTQTAEGPVECYGNPSLDDVPDNLRTLMHSLLFLDDDGDQKIYGIEAPTEEEFIYAGGHEDDVIKRKPTLRRAWLEFIDLKKYFFFWDSNFLNLYSYSRLYEVIETTFREGVQSRDNVICAFLMLLIHTGLRPHYLMEVQIDALATGDVQPMPVIKKERDRFELVIGLPIPERRTFDSSGCLFTYRHVSVPVVPFLKSYVSSTFSPSKKYLFSVRDTNGEEVCIDLTMIKGFLKEKMLGRFGLTVSPEAISNSFFSLYATRFGMDPIVACYISKNHYRVFNAPLHYIFVPKKHLSESYSSAAIKVHKSIQENRRLMERGSSIRTPVAPAEDRVFKAAHNERGYGSPQIPERATWFAFVGDLKKGIKSSGIKHLYRRHNLYSIYLYFSLMLATSLRPRNNPEIGWDTYNSRLAIMRLADKLSPKFYEERMVPVSRTVGRLIDGFRNNFPRFKDLVDDYLCPGFSDFQPSLLFFLLSKNYQPVAFELREIKRILSENYISFPLPLNTPRHYIRSSFYWENIHHELASIFMGHQTSGKEWLVYFSSVDFSETIQVFGEKVEKVLEELGFEMVRYLPAVR